VTVKELRKILKKMDGEQKILVETNACKHCKFQAVISVSEVDLGWDEDFIAVIEVEDGN